VLQSELVTVLQLRERETDDKRRCWFRDRSLRGERSRLAHALNGLIVVYSNACTPPLHGLGRVGYTYTSSMSAHCHQPCFCL